MVRKTIRQPRYQTVLAKLPEITSFGSRAEWHQACWQFLAKDPDLLNILTTAHERQAIALRAVAMLGLMAGKSYRKISKESFLSLQTIRIVKKSMDEESYRSYYKRSSTERKKKVLSPVSHQAKTRPEGRRFRTKYGDVYIKL